MVRVSLLLAALLGEVCIFLISLLVTAADVHQTCIAMLLHSWSPPLCQIYLVTLPRDVLLPDDAKEDLMAGAFVCRQRA